MKRHKLYRIISFTLAIIMFCPAISASAFNFTPTEYNDDGKAVPIDLYSESVYMLNLDTGETIVDINSEEERAPASLTKIMTAVVMLDYYKGDEAKMKKTYLSAGTEAFDELYNTGASTADIQPNEKVSAYDLLAALMIPSACEASNIIAINLGKSIDGFCDMMNAKAEELGMKNSHFSNTHGLFTQQNYSSCKDIATLCQYALEKYPVFKEIIKQPTYQMESTNYHETGSMLINTNLMLNSGTDYYYAPCKGIKTGSIDSAGRCLASYATSEGVTYLTVTMGAPMEKLSADVKKGEEDPDSIYGADDVYYNLLDHIALYKWAFSTLVSTDFINENSEVRDVNVAYGKNADYANLKPANGYNQMWPQNISVNEIEKRVTVKDNIVAPIEVGDVLGKMELVYNGEVLTTIDLVSTTKVERSVAKAELKVAKSYFSSSVFKYTIIFIVAAILIYAAIHFVRLQKKYLK